MHKGGQCSCYSIVIRGPPSPASSAPLSKSAERCSSLAATATEATVAPQQAQLDTCPAIGDYPFILYARPPVGGALTLRAWGASANPPRPTWRRGRRA
eukprot:scaffold2646_cov103-Isochrysis_galbana.AAC.4